MMWRIFVSWMNETACDWRKMYNEVLNDLQNPTQNFVLIKSRRIKWAGM